MQYCPNRSISYYLSSINSILISSHFADALHSCDRIGRANLTGVAESKYEVDDRYPDRAIAGSIFTEKKIPDAPHPVEPPIHRGSPPIVPPLQLINAIAPFIPSASRDPSRLDESIVIPLSSLMPRSIRAAMNRRLYPYH